MMTVMYAMVTTLHVLIVLEFQTDFQKLIVVELVMTILQTIVFYPVMILKILLVQYYQTTLYHYFHLEKFYIILIHL